MRLLLVYQGSDSVNHIGWHSSFREMHKAGHLESFQAVPGLGPKNLHGWEAFWDNILSQVGRQEINCLFLEYFHHPSIENPVPFLRKIRRLHPDIVIVTSNGDGFHPVWNRPPASLYQAASESDLVLTTSMGPLAEVLKKVGAQRVSLLPHSACQVRFGDDFVDEPITHDVVFVGSRTGARNPARSHFWTDQLRTRSVRYLERVFGRGFALYGHGWEGRSSWLGPVEFADQLRVAARGAVIFGGYPGSRLPYYASDRPPIQMLSGRPLVDFLVDGVEAIFGDSNHGVKFSTMEDAISSIKKLLRNETLASEIGMRAKLNVLERHMNNHRAETFFEFVSEIQEATRVGRPAKQPAPKFLMRGASKPYPISLGW